MRVPSGVITTTTTTAAAAVTQMTSAPEWSKNESSIEEAKGYLRLGNTVDFFERVCRCILQEQPEDVEKYALELVSNVLASGSDLPLLSSEFQPAQTTDPAVQPFLNEHQVSQFIDAWVLALLERRPPLDGQMQFHKEFLEARIAARPTEA